MQRGGRSVEVWSRDLPVTGPSAVPQGCPEEPHASVQAEWQEEKPESSVEPEVTQGPLPASCQVSAHQPECLHWKLCLPGCWGVRTSSRLTSLRLCSCGLLVCGRGGGRSPGWHFWEVSCRLGSSLQSSPVSAGEIQCVAWQPERARCECTAEEGKLLSGPEQQGVGMWLLGPVTLIFPWS